MRELTVTFNSLLQDKRVRAEQSKYESIQRQRASVINKYKRAYQEFLDLQAGLQSAKSWYEEMKETVESLEKNVETFVNNRRAEGAQLLQQIEKEREANKDSHAAMQNERMRLMMERMSMEPQSNKPPSARGTPQPLAFNGPSASLYPKTNFNGQYQVPSSPPPTQTTTPGMYMQQGQGGYNNMAYNPSSHGRIPGPASPPPTQANFNIGPRGPASPPPNQTSFGQRYSTYGNPNAMQQPPQPQPQTHQQQPFVPAGFVPPPPPPGPPPLGPQQTVHYGTADYYTPNPNVVPGRPPSAQQAAHSQADPWAGLSAWK
jgi:hypothetical protein